MTLVTISIRSIYNTNTHFYRDWHTF